MNLTALAGITTWLCIAVSYLRFRAGMRAQDISRSALPYRSRFAALDAHWIIQVVTCVLLFSGCPVFMEDNWDTTAFLGNYLPTGIFVVIFVSFKVGGKTRFVGASEMDLTFGLDEIERRAAEENEKDALSSEFKYGSGIRGFLKRIVA